MARQMHSLSRRASRGARARSKIMGLKLAIAMWMGAAFGLLAVKPAWAFEASHPGSVCMPSIASTADSIQYSIYGISTTSTGTRGVYCPLWEPKPVPVGANARRNIFIRVYDRSPGTKLTCTVYLYDGSGNQLAALANSTPSGFFSAAPTTLTYYLGPFGDDIMFGAALCGIPGVDAVNGASYITSLSWNSITF
jgi:hypothetical protein